MPSKKTQQQIKQQQANMQSDNVEMAGWSEGLMTGGVVETATMDFDQPDTSFSYSFGDLGQLDFFSEDDLKEKYPALKQAWEHYRYLY